MDDTNETSLGREDDILAEAGFAGAPAPELNPADYLADLEGFDITEAQKIALLETLWSIMGSIARMGFEVDVCGLIFEDFNEASAPESADGKLIASTTKETPSNSRGKGASA